MLDFKVEVDTRAFDRAFKEYVQFNKRSMSEIVNTKALFIARNAVALTKAADKDTIKDSLSQPSKVNPKVPLAAILVNKQRKAKGEAGLSGTQMQSAVNKLIRIRQATRNFFRSGWIPAIKRLSAVVPSKKGSPKMPTVRPKGKEKGGAITAPKGGSWNASATIWNSVFGGKHPNAIVTQTIAEGLQKAVDKETASMNEYVSNKLEEGIQRFNAQ